MLHSRSFSERGGDRIAVSFAHKCSQYIGYA